MRAVFITLLLGACDDGVVIEVRAVPGDDTDTVQLIVGLAKCDECPGIAPPNAPAVLDGEVLYREASSGDGVIRTAAVGDDGVARFRMAESEVADRLPVAIAIGFAGDRARSAAIIRDLPLGSTGRYRVDLAAADPVVGPRPAGGRNVTAQIWRQRAGAETCMGFERWEGGTLKDRIFIVPEDDLDCDERPAPECGPYRFDAVGVSSFEKASCTTEVGTMGAEVCKLGGPGCDERGGTTASCAPTEYCIPGAYCDLPQCDLELDMCLLTAPLTETMTCVLPFVAADADTDDACSSFEFDLTSSMPSGTTCVGPSAKMFLGEPQPGMPRVFRDDAQFVTMNMNTQFVFRVGMKHLRDCTYKLEMQGQKAAIVAAIGKRVFVQLWVATPVGETRKLLVPLSFQVPRVSANACSMVSSCHLEVRPGEELERCMR